MKELNKYGTLCADTATKSLAERAEGFEEIFKRPAAYTPAELVNMVFAEPRPDLTPMERELIREQALSLNHVEHESLAHVAAGALVQVAMLRSIFANFLHSMYHRDKAFDAAQAGDKEIIEIQEAMLQLQPHMFAGDRARKAAMARVRNSPQAAAKNEAFKLWQDWQSGKTLHKSGAAFHRFVIEKLPAITSPKSVERWCRDWRDAAKK